MRADRGKDSWLRSCSFPSVSSKAGQPRVRRLLSRRCLFTVTKPWRTPRGTPAFSNRGACGSQLVAATGRPHVLNLLHDLIQVVACRVLQRREFDVSLEMHQPQLLADGQYVPVILVSGGGCSNRSADA